MKYVTLVFYNKDGKDKVIPFENFGTNIKEAAEGTKSSLEFVEKQAAKDKVKGLHARTFEFGVPSYDLR